MPNIRHVTNKDNVNLCLLPEFKTALRELSRVHFMKSGRPQWTATCWGHVRLPLHEEVGDRVGGH